MRDRRVRVFMAGVLVAALIGCDGDAPTEPGAEVPGTETAIAVDLDATESVVADAEAALDALDLGATSGPAAVPFAGLDRDDVEEARELLRQAREKFAEARRAWRSGDTERAAELALEGRLLVAEALVLVFGEEVVDRWMERVDQIIAALEERVDDRAPELLDRILELRAEAETRQAAGDAIGAMERLILAVQIAHRERVRMRQVRIDLHGRISLFAGRSAVDLAVDLIGENMTERQAHALRHAVALLDRAAAALATGRDRVALHLGREATHLALLAVLADPDLTDADRAEMLVRLADAAIAEAEAALEDHESDAPVVRLLELAKRLQARGLELIETRPRRGATVLWYAAALAHGIVDVVS